MMKPDTKNAKVIMSSEDARNKRTALIMKIAISVVLAVFMLTGCATLLERSVLVVSEHQAAPFIRPPVEQTTVSDHEEFIAAILDLIIGHETEGQLLYYFHEGGDIQTEIERAREEILTLHPLGAFAVEEISANATRIVMRYEIDIEIEYKRTKEQMDSIINVATERSMRTNLLNVMNQYNDEAVFRTTLDLTEERIADFVRETYYQNPRQIVMLPIIVVEIYPETGTDRIYVVQFGYSEPRRMLLQFGEVLKSYVERFAERAAGNTDLEVMLSIVMNLVESITFDDSAALTIHAHGAQNLSATAYGAFVRDRAVGEGFAMAFKALTDELGLENRIVLGHLDGLIHAWNIVNIDGDYYHIDISMSELNGLENVFLKTDDDFDEMLYTWDRVNTVRCEGTLTWDDIQSLFETDETDETDQTDDDENQTDESDNGEES
ncbi:MAG: hypothetical protein FWE83_07990 [Oscillospiraceae bacterium]|nr:hypothetical protein [Oscillospiraceae bacterium]